LLGRKPKKLVWLDKSKKSDSKESGETWVAAHIVTPLLWFELFPKVHVLNI
jgi:hypothetical protein